jgi:hypothetical protein
MNRRLLLHHELSDISVEVISQIAEQTRTLGILHLLQTFFERRAVLQLEPFLVSSDRFIPPASTMQRCALPRISFRPGRTDVDALKGE